MKRKKFTPGQRIREVVTGPWLFIAAGLAYTAACMLAVSDSFMEIMKPFSISPLTYGVFIFGLLSFYIGIKTAKYALKLKWLPVIAAFFLGTMACYHVFGLDIIFAAAASASGLMISWILLYSRMRYEYLFSAGAFLFWTNFAVNGLPAMNLALHDELFRMVNPLFVLGFLFMTYSLIRMYPDRRYLFAFLIGSALLSTFRVYSGVAFIIWMLLEINNMKKNSREMKHLTAIILGGMLITVFFVFIGYSLMNQTYENWILDPLRTLEYRLAFTTMVFDDVVSLSFPLGLTFGESLKMEATEYTCRILYGCSDRITSTAFGEAMLNFGLPGVFLVSWFAGAVLTLVRRKDYAIYALLMASLIATIDVGINVFIILEFIYFGWLRLAEDWK